MPDTQAINDALSREQAPPYSFSEDAARQIFLTLPKGSGLESINMDNWREFSSAQEAASSISEVFSISPAEYVGREKEFLEEQPFFTTYALPNGGFLINFQV